MCRVIFINVGNTLRIHKKEEVPFKSVTFATCITESPWKRSKWKLNQIFVLWFFSGHT